MDAAFSVAAAWELVPGAREAELVFRPADRDGHDRRPADLVLGLKGGIRRRWRADGSADSCFGQVVARHAPAEDRKALAGLVRWVDAEVGSGQPVRQIAPGLGNDVQELLLEVSISGILRGLRRMHRGDDARVVEAMAEIFSGLLDRERSRLRATAEAVGARLVGGARVAIVRDKQEFSTNEILFDRGVQVIVSEDAEGTSVVSRKGVVLDMTHPALLAVIHAAGEEYGDADGKWFSPRPFVLTTGTLTYPATWRTRVRLEDLAAVVVRLLDGTA